MNETPSFDPLALVGGGFTNIVVLDKPQHDRLVREHGEARAKVKSLEWLLRLLLEVKQPQPDETDAELLLRECIRTMQSVDVGIRRDARATVWTWEQKQTACEALEAQICRASSFLAGRSPQG